MIQYNSRGDCVKLSEITKETLTDDDIQKIVNDILNSGEEEELKTYQNGSTVEPVYADTNCTNKIGSLNVKETCDCLGIFNERAMVRYKVDNSNNYKIGFVKWLGGVK